MLLVSDGDTSPAEARGPHCIAGHRACAADRALFAKFIKSQVLLSLSWPSMSAGMGWNGEVGLRSLSRQRLGPVADDAGQRRQVGFARDYHPATGFGGALPKGDERLPRFTAHISGCSCTISLLTQWRHSGALVDAKAVR
jgi:hypothetical protein